MKRFFALIFATLLVSAAAQARLVVISDIDDTISAAHVRGGIAYAPLIWNTVFGYNAFTGMPALFNQLAGNGADIEYVSSRSEYFTGFATRFLQETGFPSGRLTVNSKIPVPTYEYKLENIRRIMRERPNDQFIFLGDNGQSDSDVFADLYLEREFRDRIRAVFVHKVYAAPLGKLPVIGQGQFYTTSDLAMGLHDAGILNEHQTLAVLAQVRDGLSSDTARVRNLTLPKFQDLSKLDMHGLVVRAQAEKNPRLRTELLKINDLIGNLRPEISIKTCDGLLGSAS